MPVGEYVSLEPELDYWIIAQARGIWMGAVGRRQGLPSKFKFIPETGMPFKIQGKNWSQLIVFSAAQGQNTGLVNTNVVLQAGGNFQFGLSAVFGEIFNSAAQLKPNSIARLLEMAVPIQGSNFSQNQSTIASGGADVTGTLVVTQGDLISIDWAITVDTAGTSPALSNIQIKDPLTNMILWAMGMGNNQGHKTVRVPAPGNVAWTLHNGDSVAHTFAVNIYRMAA